MLTLLTTILFVCLVLYIINGLVPLPPPFPVILNVVAVIYILSLLFRYFGIR